MFTDNENRNDASLFSLISSLFALSDDAEQADPIEPYGFNEDCTCRVCGDYREIRDGQVQAEEIETLKAQIAELYPAIEDDDDLDDDESLSDAQAERERCASLPSFWEWVEGGETRLQEAGRTNVFRRMTASYLYNMRDQWTPATSQEALIRHSIEHVNSRFGEENPKYYFYPANMTFVSVDWMNDQVVWCDGDGDWTRFGYSQDDYSVSQYK